MKRLSHASKVNSTSSLTAQKTDVGVGHHHLTAGTTTTATTTAGSTAATLTAINGGTPRGTLPGKCILFPDKTSSLKSSMYTQQVYFRPDMVGYTIAKDLLYTLIVFFRMVMAILYYKLSIRSTPGFGYIQLVYEL